MGFFATAGRQVVRPYTRAFQDLKKTGHVIVSTLTVIGQTLNSHKRKAPDEYGTQARTIAGGRERFAYLADKRGWDEAGLDQAAAGKRRAQMVWSLFFFIGILLTGWTATLIPSGGLAALVIALLCLSTIALFAVLIAREALWKCQLQTQSLIGWGEFAGRDDFYARLLPWHQ